MIKVVMLCHPSSKDLVSKKAFRSKHVDLIKISCGTTKVKGVHLSESNDFFPTYASLNSGLFETSVILTVWEHADQLIGDNDVAILHTDITANFKASYIWNNINRALRKNENSPIGMTISSSYANTFDKWLIPDTFPMSFKNDPMKKHAFDNNIFVWDFIKKYDYDIYQWAMDTSPRMIYSHQFACTRKVFDTLGHNLHATVSKLRLKDVGFWTPHMFERLIGLYLARIGDPILTTAFLHYSSSGTFGPGEQTLYGPRPLKFYKTYTRADRSNR